MKRLIDKLRHEHRLQFEEYKSLLTCSEESILSYLRLQAQETAQKQFGNSVYIRGLIEVSNYCRNDCYYCGIRKSNPHVSRYRLSLEKILECCRYGYILGFRTFVLQGGESHVPNDETIANLIEIIRQNYPDCAITLSLGEKSRQAYERFFQAGANRYLLRHETFNENHYRKLHPCGMSREHRLECLYQLKEIGYQTGTGIMVGSPGQTLDDLVADLLFIEEFGPQMIGIGPFIPHKDTPFAAYPAGSVEQTLRLLSIFRLMHPCALIPATTALATLAPEGQQQGILAGANVVMPNLSPLEDRKKYELYDHKAFTGTEAAEGLEALKQRMQQIGYSLSMERGDYPQTTNLSSIIS